MGGSAMKKLTGIWAREQFKNVMEAGHGSGTCL